MKILQAVEAFLLFLLFGQGLAEFRALEVFWIDL
jgi:hypothetical protein